MTEKTDIQKLGDLIGEHAVRVARNAPEAVDVGFFGVVLAPDSDLTPLRLKNAIERAGKGVYANLDIDLLSHPDGVSYTTLGAWLGDQGLGLAFIGLGALLDLWEVILPSSTGITDEDLFQRMIGHGFVLLRIGPDSYLRS